MASIRFHEACLTYPVRHNRGAGLKEIFLRFLRRERRQVIQEVDALRNLSFHIADEERIGIIGSNGAGKSTLLRAIAGVYPLAGGIRAVEGSICSLFDINLGFEPEATGYENIHYRLYLQKETPTSVRAKIEEIAAFAELGEFMDLPIRCYSSGMLMRLAFSIATASNPEILLIDEVFSTGDHAFQRKARARMQDFMGRARIVVVVGHDLPFIQTFCTRALWLDHGQIRMDGQPKDVIAAYLEERRPPAVETSAVPREQSTTPAPTKAPEPTVAAPQLDAGSWDWSPANAAPGTERIRLRRVRLLGDNGAPREKFFIGEAITVELTYDQADAGAPFIFAIGVQDLYGSFILATHSETLANGHAPALAAGSRRAYVTLPGKLCSMTYRLTIIIGVPGNAAPDVLLTDTVRFDVLPQQHDSKLPLRFSGAIPLDLAWTVEPAPAGGGG